MSTDQAAAMAVITARNSDGTVSVDGGAAVIPLAKAAGGTAPQHAAHVLLQQLKQQNQAKQSRREHAAHVEHVIVKQRADHRAHVVAKTKSDARKTKDQQLYDHPSFFGLFRTDYALASSLQQLRAAGASPRRVGDVYRAGLQARRNEAEVKAQYLERAAAAGFTGSGPGAIYQTQQPGTIGVTQTLADILGSFSGGGLPSSYGASAIDQAAGSAGSSPPPAGTIQPMYLAAAAAGLFLVFKMSARKGKGRRGRS